MLSQLSYAPENPLDAGNIKAVSGKADSFLEAPPRIELGITILQTVALPLGDGAINGAEYEARTRYLHLGKVALYQMS